MSIGTVPAVTRSHRIRVEPSVVPLSAVPYPVEIPSRSADRAVRIVRCGGMTIAVPLAEHAVATLVATTAVRLVHDWGLVSLPAVVDRARALAPMPLSDQTAWDVVAALPRTCWLDREQSWFSFTESLGRLGAVLDKIFAVIDRDPAVADTTPAIRFDELRAALGRSLIGARQAPAPVLRRCLVELTSCTIAPVTGRRVPDKLSSSLVSRAQPINRAHPITDDGSGLGTPALTHPEAVVVQLLVQAGGELDARTLRLRARDAGVARTTVNELLKSSPVLTPVVSPRLPPAAQHVRLIGHWPLAAAAR
jgi:hypothetical protein